MLFIFVLMFLSVLTCELLDVCSTVCSQVALQQALSVLPGGLTQHRQAKGSEIVCVFVVHIFVPLSTFLQSGKIKTVRNFFFKIRYQILLNKKMKVSCCQLNQL